MNDNINVHRVAARQRKTEALVNKLIENNFTIAHIELMLPEHWDVVAEQAGVHGPSQTVINMVIREMYRIESMARATIENRRKKREPVLAGGGPR